MTWLISHYKDLLLAVLAVDAALIPLLPQVPLLVKIKEILEKVAPKE